MVGALTARSASQGDPPSSYRITRSVLMYRLVSRWQKNARHLEPTLLQFSCAHRPNAVVETTPSLFLKPSCRLTCNNRDSRDRGSRIEERELCRTPTPSQAPGCGIRFHSRKPVSKPGSCSGILGGHRETSRRIPHKIRPFLALWRRSSLYQNNRYAFVPGYSSLLVISSRIIVVAYCYGLQVNLPGRGNPTRHHV
jgi:hypothetical protein